MKHPAVVPIDAIISATTISRLIFVFMMSMRRQRGECRGCGIRDAGRRPCLRGGRLSASRFGGSVFLSRETLRDQHGCYFAAIKVTI